jgi:hypothetical protein
MVREQNAVASAFQPRVFLAISRPMGYDAHRESANFALTTHPEPMMPV